MEEGHYGLVWQVRVLKIVSEVVVKVLHLLMTKKKLTYLLHGLLMTKKKLTYLLHGRKHVAVIREEELVACH